jgi:hypothetical protein
VYQPPYRVKGFASPDDGTLDPRRNPAGIREMRGSANHKLRRKEVISMPIMQRKRRITMQYIQWELDELTAELERQPIRRTDIGFPFNVLVRFVYKALATIEALVERVVKAFVR